MSASFTITFPSIVLGVGDVWPDDDGPDDPTAEDVAAVMAKYGGLHDVLFDWNLLNALDITDDRGRTVTVT
jgi:hypothetical protein